jgi:poly(A) polymerase
MRDIWGMQPRFEKRVGRMPFRLLESPRFRAGFDFLSLRCQSGEMPAELGDWWQSFQDAEPGDREDLIDGLRTARSPAADGDAPRKKRRRRGPRKSDKVGSQGDSAPDTRDTARSGQGQPEET